MGREQEWKLAVPNARQLNEILAWKGLRCLLTEPPRSYRMQTTYYDTADRRLSDSRITLRRRIENDCFVVCVKAPLSELDDPSVRGEWELRCDDLSAALPRLVALGAPAVLLELEPLIPVCGASFLRRAVTLCFPDDSRSELALDNGSLLGSTQCIPFCELELEMKSGAPDASLRLLSGLQARFGLCVQPLSKYARARSLG